MPEALLKDSYGRAIRDLRVSVTDRCNFRCFYCLPHGAPEETAPKEALLTYEEITAAVEVFASLGVEKVRLTGGEPMLRRDIETLVAKLARVEGVRDLALTTNGFNLAERAAGLKRVELAPPKHVIGKTTVESIQSGAMHGFAAQVDGLVERFVGEIGESTVIATGGLAELLMPFIRTIEHYEPWLTLYGLRIIFERNQ